MSQHIPKLRELKLGLLICLLLISNASNAQKLHYSSKQKEVVFTGKVKVRGFKSDSLYNWTLSWLARNFYDNEIIALSRNAQLTRPLTLEQAKGTIVQIKNRKTRVLAGNYFCGLTVQNPIVGYIDYKMFDLHYTITITFKRNKYKYRINQIFACDLGDLNVYSAEKFYKMQNKRERKAYLDALKQTLLVWTLDLRDEIDRAKSHK